MINKGAQREVLTRKAWTPVSAALIDSPAPPSPNRSISKEAGFRIRPPKAFSCGACLSNPATMLCPAPFPLFSYFTVTTCGLPWYDSFSTDTNYFATINVLVNNVQTYSPELYDWANRTRPQNLVFSLGCASPRWASQQSPCIHSKITLSFYLPLSLYTDADPGCRNSEAPIFNLCNAVEQFQQVERLVNCPT